MTGHPQVNFWFADGSAGSEYCMRFDKGGFGISPTTVTGRKLLHVVSQTLSNRAAIGDFRS